MPLGMDSNALESSSSEGAPLEEDEPPPLSPQSHSQLPSQPYSFSQHTQSTVDIHDGHYQSHHDPDIAYYPSPPTSHPHKTIPLPPAAITSSKDVRPTLGAGGGGTFNLPILDLSLHGCGYGGGKSPLSPPPTILTPSIALPDSEDSAMAMGTQPGVAYFDAFVSGSDQSAALGRRGREGEGVRIGAKEGRMQTQEDSSLLIPHPRQYQLGRIGVRAPPSISVHVIGADGIRNKDSAGSFDVNSDDDDDDDEGSKPLRKRRRCDDGEGREIGTREAIDDDAMEVDVDTEPGITTIQGTTGRDQESGQGQRVPDRNRTHQSRSPDFLMGGDSSAFCCSSSNLCLTQIPYLDLIIHHHQQHHHHQHQCQHPFINPNSNPEPGREHEASTTSSSPSTSLSVSSSSPDVDSDLLSPLSPDVIRLPPMMMMSTDEVGGGGGSPSVLLSLGSPGVHKEEGEGGHEDTHEEEENKDDGVQDGQDIQDDSDYVGYEEDIQRLDVGSDASSSSSTSSNRTPSPISLVSQSAPLDPTQRVGLSSRLTRTPRYGNPYSVNSLNPVASTSSSSSKPHLSLQIPLKPWTRGFAAEPLSPARYCATSRRPVRKGQARWRADTESLGRCQCDENTDDGENEDVEGREGLKRLRWKGGSEEFKPEEEAITITYPSPPISGVDNHHAVSSSASRPSPDADADGMFEQSQRLLASSAQRRIPLTPESLFLPSVSPTASSTSSSPTPTTSPLFPSVSPAEEIRDSPRLELGSGHDSSELPLELYAPPPPHDSLPLFVPEPQLQPQPQNGVQGDEKTPFGELDLDPHYQAELRSQLPWLYQSDSPPSSSSQPSPSTSHSSLPLCDDIGVESPTEAEADELGLGFGLRTFDDDGFGTSGLGLDGFSTYTFPSLTESPALSRRKGLDLPDEEGPELLLPNDQDSGMYMDVDVDVEELGIATPTPDSGKGGESPHSRPLPRRRAGSVLYVEPESQSEPEDGSEHQVEHSFGEYGGMFVSSPIQERMEIDESSEDSASHHLFFPSTLTSTSTTMSMSTPPLSPSFTLDTDTDASSSRTTTLSSLPPPTPRSSISLPDSLSPRAARTELDISDEDEPFLSPQILEKCPEPDVLRRLVRLKKKSLGYEQSQQYQYPSHSQYQEIGESMLFGSAHTSHDSPLSEEEEELIASSSSSPSSSTSPSPSHEFGLDASSTSNFAEDRERKAAAKAKRKAEMRIQRKMEVERAKEIDALLKIKLKSSLQSRSLSRSTSVDVNSASTSSERPNSSEGDDGHNTADAGSSEEPDGSLDSHHQHQEQGAPGVALVSPPRVESTLPSIRGVETMEKLVARMIFRRNESTYARPRVPGKLPVASYTLGHSPSSASPSMLGPSSPSLSSSSSSAGSQRNQLNSLFAASTLAGDSTAPSSAGSKAIPYLNTRRAMTLPMSFARGMALGTKRGCPNCAKRSPLALYGTAPQSDRSHSPGSEYNQESKSPPASSPAEAEAAGPGTGEGATSPDRDGEDVQMHDFTPLPAVEEEHMAMRVDSRSY